MQGCMILQGDLDRPNLRHQVMWRSNVLKEAMDQLENLLEARRGLKGLVYCRTKNDCTAVAEAMQNYGALPYHRDIGELLKANRWAGSLYS